MNESLPSGDLTTGVARKRDVDAIDAWLDEHATSEAIAADLLDCFHMHARAARLEVENHATGWCLARRRDGYPIAFACGTDTLALRTADHPAVLLVERVIAAPIGFVFIAPRPHDTTFLRGTNLLREAFQRAAE